MPLNNQPQDPAPRIFISAAEPSADLHASKLIRATLALAPNARFVGVAGPKMVDAGCERVFDMTEHAAMLLGAVRAAGRGARMLSTVDRHLRAAHFDAVVVVDSPTLHFPVAAKAHALGIPVLYYIAPQLWAWGAYRIRKLRTRVDQMAAILPFEEQYFRDRGVEATYVGHPLAEHVEETCIDDGAVDAIRSHGKPVVALLPGSRKHVVESVLGGQLEVARRIVKTIPNAVFAISVASPTVEPVVSQLVDDACQSDGTTLPPLDRASVVLHKQRYAELIEAADLVLVASGTAALEVAFHRRPMIVMYNASRLFYHLIGRWLVHTPYLSLPNILAGRRIVPEFMPYYRSTEPIAEQAVELLESSELRQTMLDDLEETIEPLRGTRASHRTATILLDMIEASGH